MNTHTALTAKQNDTHKIKSVQRARNATLTLLTAICILTMAKILQVNNRAYKTSRFLLKEYADRHNIDIVALSETWHTNESLNFKDWNTKQLFKNRTRNGHGGVALLARPGIKIVSRPDYDTEDIEISWAQVYCNNKIITIASVYIPPGNTEELKKLFQNVKHIIETTNYPVLVLGDLNARSYWWESWHNSYITRNDISWKHGKIIEEYIIELGLKLHNSGEPTRDFNGQLSSPDLTLSCNINEQTTWNTDSGTILNTDHCPIIFNLISNSNKKTLCRTTWNLDKTDWLNWKNIATAKLNEWTPRAGERKNDIPAEQLCNNFTEIINELAKAHIPTKKICAHSKPFMTPELQELLQSYREARKRYKKRRDPHNWELYSTLVGEFKEAYTKARKAWWDQTCAELKTTGN